MITNTVTGVSEMKAKQRTILQQGGRVGPDPEVPEKPARRHFTAEYKLPILRLADGCTEPGSVGALLRREGLYSSHLTMWRHQRERGALDGLQARQTMFEKASSRPHLSVQCNDQLT